MKKLFNFILLSLLGLSLFGFNNDIKLENEIKVIAPMGTPYLALGGLLEEENVKIECVAGTDPLKAALVAGEYDVVVAPINLAAQLFNKGNSKYVIDAINQKWLDGWIKKNWKLNTKNPVKNITIPKYTELKGTYNFLVKWDENTGAVTTATLITYDGNEYWIIDKESYTDDYTYISEFSTSYSKSK